MENRGKVNVYVCNKCTAYQATALMNTGTTPFIITCTECGGQSESRFGHLSEFGALTLKHIWYRPLVKDFDKLIKATQVHVLRGGLLLGSLDTLFLRDNVQSTWALDQLLSYMYQAYMPKAEVWAEVEKICFIDRGK
jgi:hypothetical protein